MEGRTHALSGAALFLAVAPAIDQVVALPFGTRVLYTLITAGCAMLPDLDHPEAAIGRTFGWPTQLLAEGVKHISGGHRHATHSWVGIGAFAVVAAAGTYVSPILARLVLAAAGADLPGWAAPIIMHIAAVIMITLALGLGVRALGLTDGGAVNNLVTFTGCAGVAVWSAQAGVDYRWIPAAYALGAFAHILGDANTEQGVPWMWPHPRRYRICSIDTGEWVERRLVAWPLATLGLPLLAAYNLGYGPQVAELAGATWDAIAA